MIPAFPDLHLAPAMMLKELSPFFRRVAAQSRLVALPAPHELPVKDAMEYPSPVLESLVAVAAMFVHASTVLQMTL